MWHDEHMDEQEEARRKLRRIATQRRRLAEQEPAAIVEALKAGVRQMDVAADIGRTREHIRRIARDNGIEGDR